MARLTGRTRYQRMLSEETPPLPFNPTWKPAVTVDTADRALLARGGLKSPSPAAEAVLERLFGGESGIRQRRGGDTDVGYGMGSGTTRGAPPVHHSQPPWPSDPNLPDPGAPPWVNSPKITMAEEEQVRREVKDVEISLKEIARWLGFVWPPRAWRVKGE